MKCEVACTWQDEFGRATTVTAFAHDISAGGLFIRNHQQPPAGVFANLEIRLPMRGLHGQELQLHGPGRVVRVIDDGASSGFAVASTFAWTLARKKARLMAKAH